MKKIVVVNSKGGCGKSTLAMALCDVLDDCKIVDMDPQKSLTFASSFTKRHAPVSIDTSANYLVFDSPPYILDSLQNIVKNSDCVLVPTLVGDYDLLALSGAFKTTQNHGNVHLVYNQVPPVSRRTKTWLKTFDLFRRKVNFFKQAPVFLSQLSGYRNIATTKISGRARKEIESLVGYLGL